jgi:prepilin-type processing-associated H-X9-DG protein
MTGWSGIRGLALVKKLAAGAVIGIFVVAAYPLAFQHRIICKKTSCLSNVKQLATASFIYSADYDDHFADRDHWMDVLYPYSKNEDILRCPDLNDMSGRIYGYAFNSWLAPRVATDVESPAETPYIFESLNLARNASDPFVSLPLDDHRGGLVRRNVGYLDGHAVFRGPNAVLWRAP